MYEITIYTRCILIRITKPAKRNQPKVACAPTQLSPPLFSASNFRGLHFATTSSCSDGHPSPTTASTTAILTPANSLDSLLFPDPHPSPTGYDDLQELLNDFLAMEDMFEGEVAAYKPAGLSDIEVATANALFGDAKDASTDTI
ncbi:hypothetical protein EON65_15380 [archaeon]|nr:MAG: hypothetical protein EON65_15380 [archaeon]